MPVDPLPEPHHDRKQREEPMMNSEAWRSLMQRARTSAAIYEERARVVAVELPPRAARRRGTRWAYVIEHSSGYQDE